MPSTAPVSGLSEAPKSGVAIKENVRGHAEDVFLEAWKAAETPNEVLETFDVIFSHQEGLWNQLFTLAFYHQAWLPLISAMMLVSVWSDWSICARPAGCTG